MEKNKTGKYLKYAIGEIALVMIGILLALQVNNWNENRKSVINQNESLTKLKLNLEYDIKRFDNLDSIYNKWNEQANHIIQEVLSGNADKLDSLEDYVVGRGSLNHITIQKTTLNEMLNTGIFYKISNIELAQSITDYYETANYEINKLDRDNQNFADFVLNPNKLDEYTIVHRLDNQRNLDYQDWQWLKDPNSVLYRELEVRTLYHKMAISENQLVIKLLKGKAEMVIKKINDQQQEIKMN